MMLIEVLRKMNDIFGRNKTDLGTFSIIDDTTKDVDCADELEQFYFFSVFDEVLIIGGEFFLIIQPKEKIDKAQEGWYRILNNEGEWQTDNIKWNKDWIVFANRNDDAVYFNKADGGVYGSVNKRHFFHLSSSLADFFFILSECMKMEEEKYKFSTSDEEEPLEEFINDTRNILGQCLNAKQTEDFISFFFG
ncbi:hypothetical protein [Prevotella sp. HUN102]|uniref:hypothetical protein n=1 Tax=Prevotella sp. HUN102 TaxID=1392486 RepID=UPI00055DBE54|nr:hypothetical protein [Prevotella sp. HUN102]